MAGTYDFGLKDFTHHLSQVNDVLAGTAPQHIKGLDRLLSASGKRLRPSLVLAVAYYSGKAIDDKVIAGAAAIELVHLASLVHDDIIDQGTLRWGEPTINSKEGVDMAVLAGDYLLGKGCLLAAAVSAEAAGVLAETIAVLCEGQAIELGDNFNTERTTDSLIAAMKGKTSSMFSAACRLGGHAAGLGAEDLAVLDSFADSYGLAFQLLDDVRDFMVSPEEAGKSVGNDIREGNYTLPVLLSLHGPNGPRLRSLIKNTEDSADDILGILVADDSIERTIEEALDYRRQALDALRRLTNPKLAEVLAVFTQQSLPIPAR